MLVIIAMFMKFPAIVSCLGLVSANFPGYFPGYGGGPFYPGSYYGGFPGYFGGPSFKSGYGPNYYNAGTSADARSTDAAALSSDKAAASNDFYKRNTDDAALSFDN